MAVHRHARVTGATLVGPDTRLVDLALPDGESLGFIGGQYVILDSGLVLANGKAAKRAYSILGADSEQSRFQVAVKRIPGGTCSGFVHRAAVGTEIKFSGPWGKLFPAKSATGTTLVLATDTGITAALSLVLGWRFAPILPSTTFVWLRTAPDYFLADDFVRAHLPVVLGRVEIDVLPPAGHPERLGWVRGRMRELIQSGRLGQAFLAGDGAVNYALLDDLSVAGVPASRDSVESFFNMPKKSVAA